MSIELQRQTVDIAKVIAKLIDIVLKFTIINKKEKQVLKNHCDSSRLDFAVNILHYYNNCRKGSVS